MRYTARFRVPRNAVMRPKNGFIEVPVSGFNQHFLKSIIQKIGYDYDIEIVELEILVDHIHMIVMAEPKDSPSDSMQKIKNLSARVEEAWRGQQCLQYIKLKQGCRYQQ